MNERTKSERTLGQREEASLTKEVKDKDEKSSVWVE